MTSYPLNAVLFAQLATAEPDTSVIGRLIERRRESRALPARNVTPAPAWLYASSHAEQSQTAFASILSEWTGFLQGRRPSQLHMLSAELDALSTAEFDDRDRPTVEATALAQAILSRSHELNVLPARIVASAEGGVFLAFARAGRMANIEVFNEGVTYAAAPEGDAVMVWPVSPDDPADIDAAIARIRVALAD